MTFNCKVMTPQGQITRIKVKEIDKISCLKKLKRNGMTPIEVKESYIRILNKPKKSTALIYSKRKNFSINLNRVVNLKNKVTLEELKNFTTSFYLLKKSSFTNSHSISTIINNTTNEYFKKILRQIFKSIDEEEYMYKVMSNYPDVFPEVYVNFIKTGELTNTIEDALKYANTYLDDELKIRNKVNNTVVPNVIMFFSLIVVIFLALVLGVPYLQKIIISNGGIGNLPKTTLLISNIFSGFVRFWYIFVIIIAVMLCIIIRYVNTPDGREDLDNLKYSNIFIGKVLYLLDFTRVIRSIYLNLQNKMRLQDALEISKNATKNVQMNNLIEAAINNLYLGKSWVEPFEKDERVSAITIELLKKGFGTKSIDIIDRTIKNLDSEIEIEIDKFLKRISEISYIIVGITIVLFILLIFIPYIQIYLSELLFL